ncbi:hypothetical protein BDN72DRAFT_122226 [Pluteus cervinus]|uniref:Uncharacterized protein n=1 Tax=Pluteus cervinus TaxID=181527 RepID=A0ACD3B7I4_9AGAR|nr:hypothetical protein BDN72DRAFT_122226 [Pluteus cervinus]
MPQYPALVGGQTLEIDFAPCIVVLVLYGLLLPWIAYRMLTKGSRNTYLIGTASFATERIVVFGLRAAHAPKGPSALPLMSYFQISYAVGYTGIVNDVLSIIRVLIVNPTYGSETYPQSPAAENSRATRVPPDTSVIIPPGDFRGPPPEGTEDLPRTRFWARRFVDIMGLLFLGLVSIPGLVGNTKLQSVYGSVKEGDKSMVIRYVSAGGALVLMLAMLAAIIWARIKLARVSTNGAIILAIAHSFLVIVPIYRLAVMYNFVDSPDSTAPGSLNSPKDKALFYAFHVVPEWLTCATLFIFNIRKILATGLSGDWRAVDESEKERVKRELKEQEKREKKAAKAAQSQGYIGSTTPTSATENV